MKKTMLLLMMLGLSLALLAGCTQPNPTAEAEAPLAYDVEIKEKMFISQTNDIYLNVDEYMGKVIKYEGMFVSAYYEPTDSTYCMVYRNGPGCCGDDDMAGFEVYWADESIPMPEDNDWVEVAGTLEWYEELGIQYLRLNLSGLRVLDVRGAETVTQ